MKSFRNFFFALKNSSTDAAVDRDRGGGGGGGVFEGNH
jgi:hypothetical protein